MPRCVGCGDTASEDDDRYSLIRTGWRLVRRDSPGDSSSFDWRCSPCWTKYKAARGIPSSGMMPCVTPPAATSTKLRSSSS
jgi:hypothetical protein